MMVQGSQITSGFEMVAPGFKSRYPDTIENAFSSTIQCDHMETDHRVDSVLADQLQL